MVCQDGDIIEHVSYVTNSGRDDMSAIFPIVARMWRSCQRRYVFDRYFEGYSLRLLRQECAAAAGGEMPGGYAMRIDSDNLSPDDMLEEIEEQLSS